MRISGNAVRQLVLEQSHRAHVGHIGSALSVSDIIAGLYGGIMSVPSPEHPDRDRFILSKGHAALALYSALNLRGWVSDEDLNSYCGDGTLLGVHPECELRGVDFATGSLGQGLSLGAGAALAGRMQGSSRRVFVLMSDAECDEGSVWEAAMFASHHKLSRLILIIDRNGQQAFGYTEDVLGLEPLAERWRAFGWDVHECDGHDPEGMGRIVEGLEKDDGPPHLLLARTTFGKGVSYMESQIKWHYWPMSDAEYALARREVELAS